MNEARQVFPESQVSITFSGNYEFADMSLFVKRNWIIGMNNHFDSKWDWEFTTF